MPSARSVSRWRSWNSSRITTLTPREFGIGDHAAGEDAFGKEAQARAGAGFFETHLIADGFTGLLAHFRGYAAGGHAGGYTAGFQDQDFAAESEEGGGTRVVLPAPGAASMTRFGLRRSEATIFGISGRWGARGYM